MDSYKSLHTEYEIGWKGMLLTLANRDVPLANIKKLINTQQKISPDYNYDMKGIVMDLASSNAEASLYKPCTSIETFKYLLRLSICKRLDSLGTSRWRVDLTNCINKIREEKGREEDTKAIFDRLTSYESIEEGTSVLELALWKAKIEESSSNKRTKVGREDISYKEQCRVNSGASVVIRNVLPYLMPPNEMTIDSSDESSDDSSDSDDSNEEED